MTCHLRARESRPPAACALAPRIRERARGAVLHCGARRGDVGLRVDRRSLAARGARGAAPGYLGLARTLDCARASRADGALVVAARTADWLGDARRSQG